MGRTKENRMKYEAEREGRLNRQRAIFHIYNGTRYGVGGVGWPDGIDLMTLLGHYPDLSYPGMYVQGDAGRRVVPLAECRAAYWGLRDLLGICHGKGRHTYQDSYYLKHVVERFVGTYISNGALIAAALLTGLKHKIREGDINVDFKTPPFDEDYIARWVETVRNKQAAETPKGN